MLTEFCRHMESSGHLQRHGLHESSSTNKRNSNHLFGMFLSLSTVRVALPVFQLQWLRAVLGCVFFTARGLRMQSGASGNSCWQPWLQLR